MCDVVESEHFLNSWFNGTSDGILFICKLNFVFQININQGDEDLYHFPFFSGWIRCVCVCVCVKRI